MNGEEGLGCGDFIVYVLRSSPDSEFTVQAFEVLFVQCARSSGRFFGEALKGRTVGFSVFWKSS